MSELPTVVVTEEWTARLEAMDTDGAWLESADRLEVAQFGRRLEVRTNDDAVVEVHVAGKLDAQRAKLASAAPEMARVLLDIEWSARDATMCPSCNGDVAPAYAGATFGHSLACELDAAIRKAGLR